MTKIMMRGDLLPLAMQEKAKREYVHRFTKEHVPDWSKKPMPNGNAYQPQFASDADWLSRTLFPVIVREPARDSAIRFAADPECRSYPSWPDGVPEGGTRAHAVPVQEFNDGTYLMTLAEVNPGPSKNEIAAEAIREAAKACVDASDNTTANFLYSLADKFDDE